MKSQTDAVRRQVADVLEAGANALAPFAVLEHRLRLLANTLRDEDVVAARSARGPRAPQPTVEFTELDAARAGHALARLGVRRTR